MIMKMRGKIGGLSAVLLFVLLGMMMVSAQAPFNGTDKFSTQTNLTSKQTNLTSKRANQTSKQTNLTSKQTNLTSKQTNQASKQTNQTSKQTNLTSKQTNQASKNRRQAAKFVTVRGHQFYLGGRPHYFVGTNYWYGPLLGLGDARVKGIARLRRELDFLKANGVTNLRILAGAEGAGKINGVIRVGPALQTSPGVFDEKVLDGLDVLLAEMGRRGMKAVVFLSNNWEWSGGFQQYLTWNQLVPEDQLTRKLTWEEQRDVVSKFYSCEPCKEAYNKQAQLLLSRKNSVTGRKYVDDPTIMAWELANEPRPMRPFAERDYAQWIADVAAMIKKQAPRQLVTIGHEGFMGTENMKLFEEIHRFENIDYVTIHIWAKNWGWINEKEIDLGYQNALKKASDYIEQHLVVARAVNKPMVIEEFGLPRDGHAFDPASSTKSRDRYYEKILSYLGGHVGGANFWAFGGTARPKKGQIFWQPGDDYMGDPPMEEQGLNTVFDSDKSTWAVIKKAGK